MEKMTWPELKEYILAYNKKNDNHYNSIKKKISAAIVFDNESWEEDYDLEARTYRISNDDKYWYPECGGSSLFAYCSAESGLVRLDYYLPEWIVEYCYIIKEE